MYIQEFLGLKQLNIIYTEPISVNGKPIQIPVPEQDIGVLNDLYGWSSKEMIDKYMRGGKYYEQ